MNPRVRKCVTTISVAIYRTQCRSGYFIFRPALLHTKNYNMEQLYCPAKVIVFLIPSLINIASFDTLRMIFLP